MAAAPLAGGGYIQSYWTHSFKVKVEISDFYNFQQHAAAEDLFDRFRAAHDLQDMGKAKAFTVHGEWELEGSVNSYHATPT